jgi:SAM-dependent methyltransferase
MELGKRENYFGKWYNYVEVNGFKYWTMGSPPNISTVLNRKRSFYPMPHDLVAEVYDEQHSYPETKSVDETVVHHIGSLEGKRVLDIGCGTGWLLDQYPKLVPAQYVGIEPSEGMLRRLVSKHPTFWNRILVVKFEDYYPLEKFDVVLMLNGVGAYLREEDLQKLPMMLKPGGEFVVMTFNEHRLKEQIVTEKFEFTEVLHDTREYLALNSLEDHDISHHKLYKGQMQ